MATITKSYHPLPFEHLEPKRFEDLVRQLVYDFRRWRQLEATGRAGADDGFDARGYEIVGSDDETVEDGDDDMGGLAHAADRLWLVQCKREKNIGPTKLIAYLDTITHEQRGQLHGMIFAAACSFSKKARDAFRAWCIENRINEFYLLGSSEIEDLLYLPKNDHLLFAYFGISLQIRKQRATTEIRRLVSLKRKLNRHIPLDSHFGKAILLRDPSDSRYPETEGRGLAEGKFLWLPTNSMGIGALGLRVVMRRHWAFFDYETGHWDIASRVNLNIPYEQENHWFAEQVSEDHESSIENLRVFWSSLPRGNQFNLLLVGSIEYSEIIEIDDVGDNTLKIPTVFVGFREGVPPFGNKVEVRLTSSFGAVPFPRTGHVCLFPDEFRDLDWEMGWFARNGISHSQEKFVLPAEAMKIPD
jgi:hypothetical protein